MTATDTFTSQEAPSPAGVGTIDLERSEHLLRLLAHGQGAGLASTSAGRHCVYCGWSAEEYLPTALHEEHCPIRKARKFLRRVPLQRERDNRKVKGSRRRLSPLQRERGRNGEEEMTDYTKPMKLSARISRLSDSDNRNLAYRLRYTIPRLVEFLETHHDNEEREHEGCRACVLTNHIELELGRE